MNKQYIKTIRWFARIVGAVVVVFVLFMYIAYAIEPQGSNRMSFAEIPLILGMLLMLGGIIIAWFREKIGGIIAIGGFLLFLVYELISTGSFNAWISIIFPLLGLLYLFCWWNSR